MDYPAEFVEQLVGLSRSLAADAGIALQRVADLAVEQLNGCDMAGVTFVRDDEATTAVFTDAEAPEIDRAQYSTGQGPCLDAYRTGVILRIDETLDDERWTAFAVGRLGSRNTQHAVVTAARGRRHHRRAQLVLALAARLRRQRADGHRLRRARGSGARKFAGVLRRPSVESNNSERHSSRAP